MTGSLPLLGLLVLGIGLLLRLRPALVVVAAAVVTGLLAGMPIYRAELQLLADPPAPEGILNMLGRAFVENRFVSLFIITLPAIALSERFGLQERAAAVIQQVRAATVGRLQIVYQLFRVLVGALGIRLNGHAAFVRPLLFPMSVGLGAVEPPLAQAASLEKDERRLEEIKATDAAAENYGNFYGQNLSPVQPGILLVYGALKALGYEVSLWRMILFSVPVVCSSLILGAVQFLLLDRRERRRGR
ncbi:MAG: DUF969 domain-containing protein [Acidobacteriota bacterium]|nr:DUF969 domain-containing protein [Acidobacteriota bacterium]